MAARAIVLSMIVKNEARVIARCLDSLKPHITHFAVVDTGSTDGTQSIIRNALDHIPGEVADAPWRGFAGSRNDALDLALEVVRRGGIDPADAYFLTLDADEILFWPAGWDMASRLVDDVYGIRFFLAGNRDATWQRVLLGRLDLPWRWVGKVHEHLECGGRDTVNTLITGAHVESHTDGARARPRRYSVVDHLPPGSQIAWSTEKYQRDALVLADIIAADPNDARAVFYLAQSLCAARRVDDAIRTFERRAKMGGFAEEVYYSLFQIAALKQARGDDWRECARAHQAAYEYRPVRAEPLWALAVLHADNGEPALAELYARKAAEMPRPGDCLIVMESVYEWRAKDELGAALGRLGRFDEALAVLEQVHAHPRLPPSDRPRVAENLAMLRDLKKERDEKARAA